MYKRLDIRGFAKPVKHVPWARIKYIIKKPNFELVWNKLYYKIYKEVAGELLSHTKLRDIDYIRLSEAVHALIVQKRKEFNGRFIDPSIVNLSPYSRHLFNKMLEVVPIWCERKRDYEQDKLIGDWVDDKVISSEKKLLSFFLSVTREVVRDSKKVAKILEIIQQKLEEEKKEVNLDTLLGVR